jgi:20S proteasome alpha/beta subunit
MIGGFSNFNGKMEPDLYILHKDGIAEPMKDYATIGSGSAYAEFLLEKYYDEQINVNQAVNLTAYVISEVGKMDPNVGGTIDIIKIMKDSIENIDKKLIDKILNELNVKINSMEKNLKDYLFNNIVQENTKKE